MENYKDYIEKKVEIFPQQFVGGSFIRYEHALKACEIAQKEVKNIFSSDDMKDFAEWCRNGLLNTQYRTEKLDELLEHWIKDISKH